MQGVGAGAAGHSEGHQADAALKSLPHHVQNEYREKVIKKTLQGFRSKGACSSLGVDGESLLNKLVSEEGQDGWMGFQKSEMEEVQLRQGE